MRRASLTDVLPLSPLQEGLLFHAHYDHDAPDVYAVQLIVELAGEVDAAALRASGEALLARHANLRACFRFRKSGQPIQVIPGTADLPWQAVELSALPEAAGEEEFRRLADEGRARGRLRGPLSMASPSSRPPSVAVRAKPTVPHTAPRPRFPSAMRP